jgi:eukaryotic translation initiation factor 2C
MQAQWTILLTQVIGISINPRPALIKWESGQGIIAQVCRLTLVLLVDGLPSPQQLRAAGAECQRLSKSLPTVIVVVLPDGGNDIYSAVKQ